MPVFPLSKSARSSRRPSPSSCCAEHPLVQSLSIPWFSTKSCYLPADLTYGSEGEAMASPALGVSNSNANQTANQTAQIAQRLRIEQALKGSSSWFVLIAGLSLVNSVLSMTGTRIHFIFGLGLTQIVDAVAHNAGGAGLVLDLIINGMIAGVFVIFWNFARKG